MPKRSLSLTLAMLRRENLPVSAFVDHDRVRPRVRVKIGEATERGRSRTVTFDYKDLPRAADWTVERAIRLYPKSCIAAVWKTVRDAEASARRTIAGSAPPHEV
jgi:hypothetical protein